MVVIDVHFLARAVVNSTEHVYVVVEVERTMQKSRKRHRRQLYELQRRQVQNHCVLCASAVVVAAENHNLIGRDERGGLGLDGEGELDRQHCPVVERHVVLLDAVDAAAPLVATEHVDVGVFEDDRRRGASLLVQLGDLLPPVHVD